MIPVHAEQCALCGQALDAAEHFIGLHLEWAAALAAGLGVFGPQLRLRLSVIQIHRVLRGSAKAAAGGMVRMHSTSRVLQPDEQEVTRRE